MKDDQLTPIAYIHQLHRRIDEEIAALDNCCSKGCAHCCYQLVEVLHIEEPAIFDFIQYEMDKNIRKQVEDNLSGWLDFFEKETPLSDFLTFQDVFVDFKFKQVEENLPCPFLINNECSIYLVRPISCRVHIELQFPELCIVNRLRNTTPQAELIWSGVLAVLARHVSLFVLPLPYMVASVLLPNRELKAIRLESIFDFKR